VVFENVVNEKTKGNVEAIQAKYELLKRGTYLMNQDAGKLKVKPLEPGAPLDLAEARNAVELAKLARADHYAADTFVKASRLLADAELAREKHKKGNEVQQPARQAAQTAEDARLIALQRQDEEFQAAQRAIQGYEAINMMRNRCSASGSVHQQTLRIGRLSLAQSTVSPPNSREPSNPNRQLQHNQVKHCAPVSLIAVRPVAIRSPRLSHRYSNYRARITQTVCTVCGFRLDRWPIQAVIRIRRTQPGMRAG